MTGTWISLKEVPIPYLVGVWWRYSCVYCQFNEIICIEGVSLMIGVKQKEFSTVIMGLYWLRWSCRQMRSVISFLAYVRTNHIWQLRLKSKPSSSVSKIANLVVSVRFGKAWSPCCSWSVLLLVCALSRRTPFSITKLIKLPSPRSSQFTDT